MRKGAMLLESIAPFAGILGCGIRRNYEDT